MCRVTPMFSWRLQTPMSERGRRVTAPGEGTEGRMDVESVGQELNAIRGRMAVRPHSDTIYLLALVSDQLGVVEENKITISQIGAKLVLVVRERDAQRAEIARLTALLAAADDRLSEIPTMLNARARA